MELFKIIDTVKGDIPNSVKKDFQTTITEFQKLITGYSFKLFSTGKYEKVYLIEDSVIIYVGIKHGSVQQYIEELRFSSYYIKIEELTYNGLFKINRTYFQSLFKDGFHFIEVKFFNGFNNQTIFYKDSQKQEHIINHSEFKKIQILLPKLYLLERYNSWKGIPYKFIVFELNFFQETGRIISYIKNPQIFKYSHKICKAIENFQLPSSLPENNFYYDSKFKHVLKKISEYFLSNKSKNEKWSLEGYLFYFSVSHQIKEYQDLRDFQRHIIVECEKGSFAHIEKQPYVHTTSKWKSQELVYEYTKKLYGNYVIFQHFPYFLRTKKGQLSYDVFIPKLNVAIEYQGKQHFEPVEYFGGSTSLLKQKERDDLKAELSKKNGIKLIYINYWEDITPQLIKNKVEKVICQAIPSAD